MKRREFLKMVPVGVAGVVIGSEVLLFSSGGNASPKLTLLDGDLWLDTNTDLTYVKTEIDGWTVMEYETRRMLRNGGWYETKV